MRVNVTNEQMHGERWMMRVRAGARQTMQGAEQDNKTNETHDDRERESL